jgi:hypothetical protein
MLWLYRDAKHVIRALILVSKAQGFARMITIKKKFNDVNKKFI